VTRNGQQAALAVVDAWEAPANLAPNLVVARFPVSFDCGD
jgi:hypothetical protein